MSPRSRRFLGARAHPDDERFSARLNEVDAMFHTLSEAGEAPYAPMGIVIFERDFDDPTTRPHLQEVRTRLLPALRRRIATDRFSTALPRWVEVPGFDTTDNMLVVPTPGDGSLRAILDWAAEWCVQPFPPGRPPWRSVYFMDVHIEGGDGRVVLLGQQHHAILDGEGGRRLAERYVSFSPEDPLPALPPPVPLDTSSAWERWREGWALEGAKAQLVARNGWARLRWAAAHPRAAARRTRELVAAARRLAAAQGTQGYSPLLRKRSDKLRFDWIRYDVTDLKAGPRTLGGSLNDGFMAAMSMAMHAYHLDHGHPVERLRTAVAVNRRTQEQEHRGNAVSAVVLDLPVCSDPAAAVKSCGFVARSHLDDRDVLWLIDRSRAIANRLPQRLMGRISQRQMRGFDLQLSNVAGTPVRTYEGGVEILAACGLPTSGPSALTVILSSGAGVAHVGITTDPAAIPDPEHLVAHIDEAFRAVIGLAGSAGAGSSGTDGQ